MRDIYELIRQREADVERFEKEIERAQRELEALRLSAKLLDDNADAVLRPAAVSPTPITRDGQGYGTTPARPATTPAVTPTPWASAKQFP